MKGRKEGRKKEGIKHPSSHTKRWLVVVISWCKFIWTFRSTNHILVYILVYNFIFFSCHCTSIHAIKHFPIIFNSWMVCHGIMTLPDFISPISFCGTLGYFCGFFPFTIINNLVSGKLIPKSLTVVLIPQDEILEEELVGQRVFTLSKFLIFIAQLAPQSYTNFYSHAFNSSPTLGIIIC